METEKAKYMKSLRQTNRLKWKTILRMLSAIHPDPEYCYHRSLGGTLSRVIYVLDEAFPDWREREMRQIQMTTTPEDTEIPEVSKEWALPS